MTKTQKAYHEAIDKGAQAVDNYICGLDTREEMHKAIDEAIQEMIDKDKEEQNGRFSDL